MVVVLTYWLSFEYVRDPRRALEPESAQAALLRGAHHVLNLLMPYLEASQRAHLLTLASAYQTPTRHPDTLNDKTIRRQPPWPPGPPSPMPATTPSPPPAQKSNGRACTRRRRTLPQRQEGPRSLGLFHAGEFERATEAGLAVGGAGITAANKAQAIYATYLEPKEKNRLDLFLQVAERAEAQAQAEPGNANAWYWHAYALGRYSQGISVAKALAQGLGGKIKTALEKAIALAPAHADAHIALGAFHAEVIDKVGALMAA